jgi:hypothetical protein
MKWATDFVSSDFNVIMPLSKTMKLLSTVQLMPKIMYFRSVVLKLKMTWWSELSLWDERNWHES